MVRRVHAREETYFFFAAFFLVAFFFTAFFGAAFLVAFFVAFFAAFFAMVLLLPEAPGDCAAVLPGKSTDANHKLRVRSVSPTVVSRVYACCSNSSSRLASIVIDVSQINNR